MKKLIQVIKSIKLSQVLTVFLASTLLVISTACSQGNMAQTGGKAYTDTAKRAMSDTYDDYDADRPFVGGMNGYNDDPRYNAETEAKTKALVDGAKDRSLENIGDTAEIVSDRAQETIETTKNKAQRAFNETTDKARNAVEDATRATKETAKDIKGNLEDLT